MTDMRLQRVDRMISLISCLSVLVAASPVPRAQSAATGKALTIERIYSQPSLNGRMTRGLTWTPDGKQLSYFETKGSGKETKTELWVMDAANGERRLLVASDKLESILPPESSKPTQATGLGRRAPSQYLWVPDGSGLIFIGPSSLAWFDVKSQSAHTILSGKEPVADVKLSPNGKYVSFVQDHNIVVLD
jgi:dipeptidyl-peptidase-4